jgi:hypothetical protein
MESFIGSIWFATMTFLLGYLFGHALPINWVASKFSKK